MSPLADALAERGLLPTLVFTGQQELDAADYGLERYPAVRLNCRGRPHPHAHVRDVRRALAEHIRGTDLVVVQGDTSSALGGALAAFEAKIPVAHVEAGLRTYDARLPWPEEEYRVAIDARAELLFAPTQTAAQNLRNEGVPGEIFVTGNTGIDAVLGVESLLPPPSLQERFLPHILVTCHRRESWGDGLASIGAALIELASQSLAHIELVLHPNPRVARSMREMLARVANITLLEPCSHRALIQQMREADLILSDSGGIQEEAPALGKPLLVLRDKTERPEAIASGSARLVGTATQRIVEEVRRLLSNPLALAAMSRRGFPFGDGRSAPRIAEIVDEWLARRGRVHSAAAIMGASTPNG
jgi:UDP-N-acetylglucosamine 2-epimerase (non-hydrolysing)